MVESTLLALWHQLPDSTRLSSNYLSLTDLTHFNDNTSHSNVLHLLDSSISSL